MVDGRQVVRLRTTIDPGQIWQPMVHLLKSWMIITIPQSIRYFIHQGTFLPILIDVKACYVFTPASKVHVHQKKKRRKQKDSTSNTLSSVESQQCFDPLLESEEEAKYAKLRHATYQTLWSRQADRIAVSHQSILITVRLLTRYRLFCRMQMQRPSTKLLLLFSMLRPQRKSWLWFLQSDTEHCRSYDGKIPAGLILAGPSIAAHGLLFQQLATRIRAESRNLTIVLTSAESVNLKTVLKNLIRNATSQAGGLSDDRLSIGVYEKVKAPLPVRISRLNPSKASKHLNYDLQILFEYITSKKIDRVVIACQDSEAFDSSLLAELVGLFRYSPMPSGGGLG